MAKDNKHLVLLVRGFVLLLVIAVGIMIYSCQQVRLGPKTETSSTWADVRKAIVSEKGRDYDDMNLRVLISNDFTRGQIWPLLRNYAKYKPCNLTAKEALPDSLFVILGAALRVGKCMSAENQDVFFNIYIPTSPSYDPTIVCNLSDIAVDSTTDKEFYENVIHYIEHTIDDIKIRTSLLCLMRKHEGWTPNLQ